MDSWVAVVPLLLGKRIGGQEVEAKVLVRPFHFEISLDIQVDPSKQEMMMTETRYSSRSSKIMEPESVVLSW